MANKKTFEPKLPIKTILKILGFLEKESSFELMSYLEKKDITKKQISNDNYTLEVSFLTEPILNIINEEKDYSILSKLGKYTIPNNLGILGYLMIHSKNVYDAIDRLCRYFPLIRKKMKLVFTYDEVGYKIVLFFYNKKGDLVDLDSTLVMLHFFNIIHLVNYIIPNKIQPLQMKFIQDKPSFPISDGKIENINSFFAQEENSIYFARDILKTKTSSADEYLLKTFEKEAENILNIKLSEDGLKERISELILTSSTQLDVSLDSVASKVGLSPRVIQKRLKKEGSSFSDILLEMRKKLTIYYLSKDIDLATISLSIGYLDISTFFRAFKKWYGITPTQWKEINKDNNLLTID